MRIIKLTEDTKKNLMEDLLKRSPNNYSQYEATVNEIIENVKANKNQAIFDYTLKFDKFQLTEENIKVTREEIDEAYTLMDAKLVEVIKKAAALTDHLVHTKTAVNIVMMLL